MATQSLKFDIHSLVRPNIRVLTPYRCARDDYDQGILLDANENPYGSVPADPRELNRYPDPYQLEFRKRYASFRGIEASQVFCGVGSDEAIDLVLRIFCKPGESSILITPPTYGMYKVSAAVNDLDVIRVPLSADFQLRADAVLAAARPETRVIFLCSPNNPTGNIMQRQDIRRILLEFDGIVVVDEAYIDFTDEPSFASELDAFENLIVLQTLSKSFGLAGIRMGVALASSDIINYMMRVKAPYNINKLTTESALRAMDHLDEMRDHVQQMITERKRLEKELPTIPAVQHIFPSDANFLLVRVSNAFDVYKKMADAGIVGRYRGDEPQCENTIRISVGTPEQNDQLIAMLKEFPA